MIEKLIKNAIQEIIQSTPEKLLQNLAPVDIEKLQNKTHFIIDQIAQDYAKKYPLKKDKRIFLQIVEKKINDVIYENLSSAKPKKSDQQLDREKFIRFIKEFIPVMMQDLDSTNEYFKNFTKEFSDLQQKQFLDFINKIDPMQ